MLRRVDGDDHASAYLHGPGLCSSEPIVPAVSEAEFETPLLPHDHPKWVKDTLTVSQRARDIIARLQPVVINILTFWDHRIRSIAIGDIRLTIDASGGYRAR